MPKKQKEKKDYEKIIDGFEHADAEYKKAEEAFLSGEYLDQLLGEDPNYVKEQHKEFISQLRTLLETRNSKLQEAATALRKAVQSISPKQRGPAGTSSTVSYGPLTGSSATSRSIDPPSLLEACAREGILDQVMELTTIDKKTGKTRKIVETSWNIEFNPMIEWLSARELKAILDASYVEKDLTPKISGAKQMCFLGEVK